MPVDPEDVRRAIETFTHQSAFWRTEADRYANLAAQADDPVQRASYERGAASVREASQQTAELAAGQQKQLQAAFRDQAAAAARDEARAEQVRAAQAREEAQLAAEQEAEADAKAARDREAARAAEIDFQLARGRIERGRGRNATRDL